MAPPGSPPRGPRPWVSAVGSPSDAADLCGGDPARPHPGRTPTAGRWSYEDGEEGPCRVAPAAVGGTIRPRDRARAPRRPRGGEPGVAPARPTGRSRLRPRAARHPAPTVPTGPGRPGRTPPGHTHPGAGGGPVPVVSPDR
ncbi:hypothetical protein BKD26_28985 [Streptomyces sp. CB03238]|nr:hypothetical protein BKD26_28985 [Streptomyces sp. CB03238]